MTSFFFDNLEIKIDEDIKVPFDDFDDDDFDEDEGYHEDCYENCYDCEFGDD